MTWNYHKVLFSEEGAQNENNARVLMMSNFFLRNIFFIPASAAVGTALHWAGCQLLGQRGGCQPTQILVMSQWREILRPTGGLIAQ